ncbi:Monocopper oxidase-like protein SKS1 [Acorus calamus]|uniref:Monocopper oxidase-like protein SKS1 n=1 Tax=Acorus calamus TaxID=4465 RepID=A0AAV9FFP6_ACOCL|nr:Monocopper oxidase-like protein SKS1 [Acorus calamus]
MHCTCLRVVGPRYFFSPDKSLGDQSGFGTILAVQFGWMVYRNSWSAVLVSLDNKGMWNLRPALWERQYLGQQFYIKIWNSEKSYRTEYDIPTNALLCGKAVGRGN